MNKLHDADTESLAGPNPYDDPSLTGVALINAMQLAKLLGISERTLYRLKSTGQLPLPIVLGGSVRWRLTEVRNWIANGCPTTPDLK
jgi:excisionase family DNA binding protein